MNYQKQEESKYKVPYFCTNPSTGERMVLIGIGKEFSEDEISTLAGSPLLIYNSEFINTYFKLNGTNRQIVRSVLEKFEKEQNTDRRFHPDYWDAVVDFIFTLYGKTLYDIANDLTESYPPMTRRDSKKTIYDRLDKLKESKGKPGIKTLNTIREVCAFYLLTDSLVRTGNGKIYSLVQEDIELQKQINERYTLKKIRECWEKDREKELKDIILELTELQEEQLQEMPIQIAFSRNTISSDVQKCIMAFMEELHNRQ